MNDEIFIIDEHITVNQNEVETIKTETVDIVQFANEIKVTDEMSYQGALSFAKECAEKSKKVEKRFEDQKKKANELHKSITKMIKDIISPFMIAKKISADRAYAWKKAEEERIQKEQLAKIEAEKKRIEEEKLREAERLVLEGNTEEAEKVIEQPIVVEVEQEKKPQAVAGVSHRENWQAEVVDFATLVDTVSKNHSLLYLLQANNSELNKLAKALKDKINIPGVKAVDKGTTVFR